jgi:hypothetical protein
MILFDLRCGKDHVFEAWFRDSETYDAQAKGGEIACSVCGDTAVAKALMTPNVATSSSESISPEQAAQVVRYLSAVRDHVEKTHDNVGDKFPEEARKIHYGETEKRNIYGNATADDARELDEEGIEFGVLPAPAKRKTN